MRLFARWFAQARRADPVYHNAMTLATVAASGAPSARVVLLKAFGDEGFTFFTNYHSRKGRELAGNQRVALVFWWSPLKRQVRIEGRVTPVSRAESEAYFNSRPRAYRVGAWASRQSAVIASRRALLAQARQAAARFANGDVPCPPHWGGYRVTPTRMEFWTDQPNRLHDRLAYRRVRDGRWTLHRLSP